MLLFLPVRTDAPAYHFPWATIGLMAAAVLVFLFGGGWSDPERLLRIWADYGLRHGDGLTPVQWFTSCLLHTGLPHLLGNLIFLWTFGLIVEGKVGAVRLLAICTALAAGSGLIEQILMRSADGGVSGGLSGLVAGLMVIAVLWAPKNDVGVAYVALLFVFLRVGVFEVSVLAFAGLSITWDALLAARGGFAMSTPLLHTIGAAVGGLIGYAMLRLRWVDCEDWDLLSVIAGRHRRRDDRSPHAIGYTRYNETDPTLGPSRTTRRRLLRRSAAKRARDRRVAATPLQSPPPEPCRVSAPPGTPLRDLLADGRWSAAWSAIGERRRFDPTFAPPPPVLLRLAEGLDAAGDAVAAVAAFEELLADDASELLPSERDRARLRLAGEYLTHQSRPRAAADLLDAIDADALPPADQDRAAALRSRCGELIDSGILELRGRSW